MIDWRSVRLIASTLFTVGSLSAIVKITGAFKVIYFAGIFGTRDEMDAYLIAFLLPSFVADITAGALCGALVPCFIAAKEKAGLEAVRKLVSNLGVLMLLSLAGFSILLAVAADVVLPLLASGFADGKLALTKNLFFLLLPILPLSVLCAIWRGVLYAQGLFAAAAALPVLTPLSTIAVVALSASIWGPYSLAAGSVIGAVLELLALLYVLKRNGLTPGLRWFSGDEATNETLRQSVPLLGAALVSDSGNLITQALAATLPSGSVSALTYAAKVLNVILAVGPGSLGTAVLPHFSKMFVRDGMSTTWTSFRSACLAAIAMVVPGTLLLIAISEPLTRVLYERGAFVARDTKLVSLAQTFYFLQLPAIVVGVLTVRLMMAFKKNWQVLQASLVHVTTLAAAGLSLVHMGVSGLALASSIAATCYTLCLMFILWKTKREEEHA